MLGSKRLLCQGVVLGMSSHLYDKCPFWQAEDTSSDNQSPTSSLLVADRRRGKGKTLAPETQ